MVLPHSITTDIVNNQLPTYVRWVVQNKHCYNGYSI